MSTELVKNEFEKTSLQIEPDNSNAEQSEDTYHESLLDSTILTKVEDRAVFNRKGRNEWELVIFKYEDSFNIVDEKGNLNSID